MSETTWSWLTLALLLPVSLGFTRLMIYLGPKLGLIDVPDERRIHTKLIPRAGGIAVFLTMLIGMVLLHAKGHAGILGGKWMMHFLAGSTILVVTGIADDRYGISAWVKLGVQILASAVMFSHNPSSAGLFMGFQIPWFVDLGIHVFWTVALINAFNLIDGMDGLCGGLGTIALLILAALAAVGDRPENAFLISIMVVALLGFLRYNFHPARIFLGDTGSMLVGFFLASVGTETVGKHAVVAGLLMPLLVGGIPLLDVGLAVWRRGARRIAVSRPGQATIKIFGPDRDHLHHRLLNWGLTQRQAVVAIYAFAAVISLIALLPILGGANFLTLSVVGIVIIGLVGLRYIAPVEFLESGRGLRALIRKPRSSRMMMLCYLCYDAAALAGSFFAGWWILSKASRMPIDWIDAVSSASIFTGCTVAAMGFAKAHARRWTRASAHDFAECTTWLFCGAGISFTLLGMSQSDFSFHDLAVHCIALCMGATALFAPRSVGFLLQESVIDTMHRKRRLRSRSSKKGVIIYGAGDLGELFVCHLRLTPPDSWMDYHFIGFIDDNESLRGRRLRGFPILGSLEHLPTVVKQTGATSIMVTSSVISEEKWQAFESLARELGLEVQRWQPALEPENLIPGRNASTQAVAPPTGEIQPASESAATTGLTPA
ncbi:hypothetical protein OKA04_21380 [Luteolibacter flavescens]|uniref:Undecaprenyl/decaprenyl-phosphate alpha-N-acetylglucosaminyl 1-phosphate transferase n=1 Tax=Luteolibacter flavescens TaxID=1859460 RepID=A0ABT3FUN4_9BACT|nr:hypothetical protein [Luteolibacter flavescens]MCW1887304.1 hypothetical protein [Luteolibacter flavescens]